MAVYILSNKKIVHHKGERAESFSNAEYLIPNFRIAGYNFEDNQETPETSKKKKDNTHRNVLRSTLFPEPEKQGYQEVREACRLKKGSTHAHRFILSAIGSTFAEEDLPGTFKFEAGNHWSCLSGSTVQNAIFKHLNRIDGSFICNRIKNNKNTPAKTY